tara:strand:+ start:320 stop:1348 length:1029 start_codon:yes stop_codon:yes gene_type:complete
MQLKNKILLITGGTGSFGNAVLEQFLRTAVKEIRIFSRDEKKQDDMRKNYSSKKIKFYLGDVRDKESIKLAIKDVDYIFHAAALKQVPSCEFYPMEAVKTNIVGTQNVIDLAIDAKVKKIICLSTDKAVHPINTMGISKALMEKVAISKSLDSQKTIICITRYGNVIGSRGSVIPLFINSLIKNKPLTITDPSMTRFMMSLEEAVKLVFFALENGKSGEIFVQKSPAASIKNLSSALFQLLSKTRSKIVKIGIRHGEKIYETLLTKEEMSKAIDLGRFYKIPPDFRDLNYDKFVEKGARPYKKTDEYNSHNTKLLNIKEIKELLLNTPNIKKIINTHNKSGH